MIEIIPTIVAGGVAKKFSDAFIGKPNRQPAKRKTTRSKGRKSSLSDKYSPFKAKGRNYENI